jgi:hypothetical protein
MTRHRLETISELLHDGDEGQPAKLRETAPTYRRAKAKAAELLKTIPRRHPLVLLEGVVPRLGRPPEW